MKNLDDFANMAKRARRERPPTVNVADRVMAAVASETGGEIEIVSLSEWLVPVVAATLSLAAAAIFLFWMPTLQQTSDPLVSLLSGFQISVE